VEPLFAGEASQEAKVLRNLKVLEKEIQDAYAKDHKKLKRLVDGLSFEEERNENKAQNCNKTLEQCIVEEPLQRWNPEIACMCMNDTPKEETDAKVLRQDSQQRNHKGTQLVGSELRKMQQELVSRFRANGCSWQASTASSKSSTKSVSWDCSEASDSPAGEMMGDAPQNTVVRQVSFVPPLRLPGLCDVPRGAVWTPGQSARPVRFSAREQIFATCRSQSNSSASLSTTCSSPGLAPSSNDPSPREDVVRLLSCNTARDPKPMSSATKEDLKPFQGCRGGSVRTNSTCVNPHPFASHRSSSVQSSRPLSCR
jgi:hypothetical protein